MQIVPAARLEGYRDTEEGRPPPTPQPQEAGKHSEAEPGDGPRRTQHAFIPTNPSMDREVAALHALARRGIIAAETAERQINTYLLVPHTAEIPVPPRWLLLPLADAPHHGMLPDLGHILHRVLARDPVPCSLSTVMEQCIPRLRHTPQRVSPDYKDSQPVLITLVMGLLLGLYAGCSVKKPTFRVRSALFARLHGLLTATAEAQTAFCSAHEDILLLACMEYLVRVVPVHMPVHHQAINQCHPQQRPHDNDDASAAPHATAAFYRRIPPMCDELRQWLDDDAIPGDAPSWQRILAECTANVERVARLKRGQHHQPQTPAAAAATPHVTKQESHATTPLTPDIVARYWAAPRLLHSRSARHHEYRLLATQLGLQAQALQLIQQELTVTPLPRNLKRMQTDAMLQHKEGRTPRASYLQSRWHVCGRCMLAQRPSPPPLNCHQPPLQQASLRLDTLTQRLVCTACLSPDPISVNMVGRTMQLRRGRHFYLCPACCTVQEYKGLPSEQPWSTGACHHAPAKACQQQQQQQQGPAARKEACSVCSEHALVQTAWRVDHLTGEMLPIHFCQRHAPRPEIARHCVNARQLAALRKGR